ncbi:hypothetical protein LSH36_669g04030 [Paralvinella palmiformis]|uniref:Lysosome-associated membrane glycoprotein 5 n=1 Tax=Paralvinella palmiformis TaxID=53620 RepID=A0AAD9J2W8_9ANNE|nr:hypothetical protein LSH36_669g04030 [Paralvinella palmiformis]
MRVFQFLPDFLFLRAKKIKFLEMETYAAPNVDNKTGPPIQLYKVHNKTTGHNCILLQAGIRLHFNYSVNGTKKNATYELDVPENANKTATGTCGNATQSLRIHFAEESFLTLFFNKTATFRNLTQFEYTCGKGFLCLSNMTLPFNNTTPLVQLDTVKLRVEAFRNLNTTSFSPDYTQCDADSKISNIIPIAVGAALGALVLIVLIAYLVGRKRSQRGGYETV